MGEGTMKIQLRIAYLKAVYGVMRRACQAAKDFEKACDIMEGRKSNRLSRI